MTKRPGLNAIIYGLKDINSDDSEIWDPEIKFIDIEGTAVECHNTLRMPDGK